MFGSGLSCIYESNNQAQQIRGFINGRIYSCICQGKSRRKRLERRGPFKTEGLEADWTNLFVTIKVDQSDVFLACPSPLATAWGAWLPRGKPVSQR